jgi:NAD(P)-dependent dehydrogenase (short-subunit alcohol dehydrogenase family)
MAQETPPATGITLDFSGRNAVVTGAGGGMGLAIARMLLAGGAQVTGLDLKPRPEALGEGPGGGAYVELDLTHEGAVVAAMAAAFKGYGRLDYLVNAAGVLWFDRDRSALDIDLDIWDQVLAANLTSAVHTARHAVPYMRRSGGGAMVHFSSVQALRGDPKPQDAYQAAKAGLIALSKSLAIQLAADGIRSNVILPGSTLTPMQARWDEDKAARTAAAAEVPLGRLGRPEDMANACLFLLSDRAAYITGTELVVDGGITALP